MSYQEAHDCLTGVIKRTESLNGNAQQLRDIRDALDRLMLDYDKVAGELASLKATLKGDGTLEILSLTDDMRAGMIGAANQMWPRRTKSMDIFRVEDGIIKLACYEGESVATRIYLGDVKFDPMDWNPTRR